MKSKLKKNSTQRNSTQSDNLNLINFYTLELFYYFQDLVFYSAPLNPTQDATQEIKLIISELLRSNKLLLEHLRPNKINVHRCI